MPWLIFPHQLFRKKYDEKIVLMEHPRFFTDFDFHKQKLLLHRASMKEFGSETPTTDYLEFDGDLEKPFRNNRKLKLHRPEDHDLKKWVEKTAEEHDTELKIQGSPMFLTSMDWNREYFRENDHSHQKYYKTQRKRLEVMVDDEGDPEGGKWSFDPENREKMPEDHQPPNIPEFHSKTIEEAKRYVEKNFSDNPGSLTEFIYPIKREQALENLKDFLKNRLENFGRYQDAIDRDLTYGYHSVLSPSLNIGLITPDEVIDKTLKTHEREDLPLNSVEGFIRQIIGWREFVRAIYHLEPNMKNHDFWNNKNQLPDEFYTANTSIPPIDQSINRVKNNAYTPPHREIDGPRKSDAFIGTGSGPGLPLVHGDVHRQLRLGDDPEHLRYEPVQLYRDDDQTVYLIFELYKQDVQLRWRRMGRDMGRSLLELSQKT